MSEQADVRCGQMIRNHKAVIPVEIQRSRDFFNPFDQNGRMLSDRLLSYIEESVGEVPLSLGIQIVFYYADTTATQKDLIVHLLRNHYKCAQRRKKALLAVASVGAAWQGATILLFFLGAVLIPGWFSFFGPSVFLWGWAMSWLPLLVYVCRKCRISLLNTERICRAEISFEKNNLT